MGQLYLLHTLLRDVLLKKYIEGILHINAFTYFSVLLKVWNFCLRESTQAEEPKVDS